MPISKISVTFLFAILVVTTSVAWGQETTRPVEGLRENAPDHHALVGAKIVTEPGKEIANGTLIVKHGIITDIGANVEVPADAKVWNVEGRTIYPGFIDAYSEVEVKGSRVKGNAAHWNALIVPERRVADQWTGDENAHKDYRKAGFVARLIAPNDGIIRGASALVSTKATTADRSVLVAEVAQHIRLTARRGGRDYPRSPMGAVALARQTFYDSQWYALAWKTFRNQKGIERPESNRSLQTLVEFSESDRPIVFSTPDEQYLLRADQFAREFQLNAIFRGSGSEYRRLNEVIETSRPIILPLNFPSPPDVSTASNVANVSLERLMHWDHAPSNPAILDKAGVELAFSTHQLKGKGEFLKNMRIAVKRGLSSETALSGLTTTPARMFGVDDRMGKLARGYQASFIVADGDIFHDKSKLIETWVDGQRFEIDSQPKNDLTGEYAIEAGSTRFTILISSHKPLKVSIKSGDKNAELKKAKIENRQLVGSFDSELIGKQGISWLSAAILDDKKSAAKLMGELVWPDGTTDQFAATGKPIVNAKEKSDDSNEDSNKKEKDAAKSDVNLVSFPINYPLGSFGLESQPNQLELIAFKNATIWTCAESGTIQNATLLVRKGVIVSVGENIDIPENARVVDCAGKHITPGIIDCHSHMATDGGVNEGSQAITSEVRIGDFIDASDINIYRQLAGGVTTSNILHGSANPIGGQNQVIKLRWGANPEQLKFAEAPKGIKFALGENVKQANWGDQYTTRYPQTRMGVEQIIRDAFLAARQYRDRWIDWRTNGKGMPPRRDLELDALVEVLEQKRWIHCHSYRQDEILALLRTLESFNIRIGTLQHILEGYKIAEVMKAHGAMGSSFSDWWAYKFEVYDAIPFNGSLMHQVGVNVSFNSDDRELARHLNHEAAKAIKYGGVSEVEALKFVTLNPAIQLRIDHLVGSLAAGKHADLVIWNGPPLSTLSRCEQTWVDGRKYFDFDQDRTDRKKWRNMKNTLVQKILNSGKEMTKQEKETVSERDFWPRVDLYCRHRLGRN